MKTHKTAFIMVLIVGLGIVLSGWLMSVHAASKEYEVVVPEAKSDTQRMIEAYERLSDQYLALVQNQLLQMSANDRDVLVRLERMEKKIDELSARIDAMQKHAAPARVKTEKLVEPETTER